MTESNILRELIEQLETEATLTEQLDPAIVAEQQWTEPVTVDKLLEELGV